MNIYVSHSSNFDYEKELYSPIKDSDLYKNNTVILPHEVEETRKNSKEYIRNSDMIIAEVSYPSTGQGIELGWAESFGKRIICIHKKGNKLSNSLKAVSSQFIEYEDINEVIRQILNLNA